MNHIKVLWVDDEIDLLKPHIIFLEGKGYNVTTCQSGTEALENDLRMQKTVEFLVENAKIS